MSNVLAPGVGLCDGCWCAPSGGATCPSPIPQTTFAPLLLSEIQDIGQVGDDFALTCDPFRDSDCLQPNSSSDTAVCAYDVLIAPEAATSTASCLRDYSYQ